jgi:urease accessory protein
MASFILVSPRAGALLDPLRKLLPDTGGASLIRDGVLFGRIVARDGFALRGALVPVLTWLNESPLPRTWTL